MHHRVDPTDYAGASDGRHYQIDLIPDVCPLCHHALVPMRQGVAAIIGADSQPNCVIEVVLHCTRRACGRLFIGRYRQTWIGQFRSDELFQLFELTPQTITPPSIPEEVRVISPTFAEVYVQAHAAEAHKLAQIAGVGYRRALEFLVKDFCVSEEPTKKAAIEAEFLGQTIANRVKDANVKACAERAAWLGNDETHYVRKWEDKDIRDLKTLIELTMGWIRQSALTKGYLQSMPQGKK